MELKILKQQTTEINRILKCIPTKDITDMNNLLLKEARVVQMKVGINRNKNGKVEEPVWKRRLRLKMSRIRIYIGRVGRWKRDELERNDIKCE